MSYTATPWGRRNAGTPTGPSARHEIVAGKRVIARMDGLDREDYDNAAYIVRCVNAHDELVAALQKVYEDIELQNVPGGSDELNLLVQAALTKATEETK